VLDGVIVSNGIDWSPDGATLYYSDSATRVVRRFPFDPEQPNRLGVPETLAAFTAGFPDGLTVDADGGIWVAEWSGGRVVRLLPEGMIEAEVRLPVSRVTSCAFGGPGLRTLFVTTASSGEDHPEAGMLFACEPGGAGMPPREFAG
jgi:sugar lactone lactonase YvrE